MKKFFTRILGLDNRRQNFVWGLHLLIKHIFHTENITYTFYSLYQVPGGEYNFRFVGDNGEKFTGKITFSILKDKGE